MAKVIGEVVGIAYENGKPFTGHNDDDCFCPYHEYAPHQKGVFVEIKLKEGEEIYGSWFLKPVTIEVDLDAER